MEGIIKTKKDDIVFIRFPTKQVTFSEIISVKYICHWSFAHRNARKGHWEEYARDRDRFQRRIQNMTDILIPVIKKKICESRSNLP